MQIAGKRVSQYQISRLETSHNLPEIMLLLMLRLKTRMSWEEIGKQIELWGLLEHDLEAEEMTAVKPRMLAAERNRKNAKRRALRRKKNMYKSLYTNGQGQKPRKKVKKIPDHDLHFTYGFLSEKAHEFENSSKDSEREADGLTDIERKIGESVESEGSGSSD
jgi:hypothetical protein